MKQLIVANWKMNPQNAGEAQNIFNFTYKSSDKLKKGVEIIICPPFVYIPLFSKKITAGAGIKKNLNIKLGAQNCFFESKGAFTGEISPSMLRNLNCEYVILGHSERRNIFSETNDLINKKIKFALKSGLNIIFCVGENLRDEEFNYFNFIKNQIEEGLKDVAARELNHMVIAYEPVWAISSNKDAKAMENENDLNTIAVFIRKTLFNMFKTKKIFEIPIIYGGSVNKDNFKSFLNIHDLSGFLIGGASVKAEEIKKIFGGIL